MIDLKNKKDCQLSQPSKIREAEKMIEDGGPLTVICKVLNISADEFQFLGQRGFAAFK